MEKYEQISVIGEGSYGLVMKCRHRETDQLVAVKKFLESEEDAATRKITFREIEILKRLKHENLVILIEVFRYKKRLHLVFEFLEWTVLDELDRMPSGLGEEKCKERIFQVLRAICYCHANHIIHRDVKPENVLVSSRGVVKLCDFGFARRINTSNETCTEYVATRWYRAPELLIGERSYGTAVDIWAVGCLFAEMMTGDPLFPGNSDVDQLYLIVKVLGKPCLQHRKLLAMHRQFQDLIETPTDRRVNFYEMFPSWSLQAADFLNNCMKMNPGQRLTADELLKHVYFLQDNFSQRFLVTLKKKIDLECCNPLLRKVKNEHIKSADKHSDIRYRKVVHNTIKRNLVLTGRKIRHKFNSIPWYNAKNSIIPIKTDKRLSNFKGNDHIIPVKELYVEDGMYDTDSSKPQENNPLKLDIKEVSLGMELHSDSKYNKIICEKDKQNTFLYEKKSLNKSNEGTPTKSCNLEMDKHFVSFTRNAVSSNEKKATSNSYSKSEKKSKSLEITAAYRYEKAKRKRNTLDISLPFAVEEKVSNVYS